MLINEVDAIPQRNCLNLSDLKKRSFTHLMHSVVRMLSTHNKTRKTVAATGSNGREEETKEAR